MFFFNLFIEELLIFIIFHSGEVYSIQHYVIQFVSDLRYVSSFLRVLAVSSTNKTDRLYITEMLLKVALNTISPNPTSTTYHIIIIRA
jgi:hypothetical protein